MYIIYIHTIVTFFTCTKYSTQVISSFLGKYACRFAMYEMCGSMLRGGALWLDASTCEKEAFDLLLEAVQGFFQYTVYSSSKFSVVEINIKIS